MTTILPEKNKKELKRDYVLSMVSKFLNILILVLIVWLIFEFVVYQITSFENKSALKEQDAEDFVERNKLISDYQESLKEGRKIIETFPEKESFKKDILDYIFSLIPNEIVLKNISIEEQEDNLFIIISGFSATREVLSDFNNNLGNQDQISEINLPPSVFTKTFDIDFNMSFKYQHAKK